MGTTTASENAKRETAVLAMSFELGATEWKMAFSPALGQAPRHAWPLGRQRGPAVPGPPSASA